MHNCQYYCYSDVESGLFTDQKFCNYLPVFIEKTKIYHGAEANIAYWNLHEREISEKNGVFLSNDREVLFFHFSGIVYDKNFKFKYLSKHENRYKSEIPNDLANKINKYLEQLSLNTKLFRKLGIDDKYSLDEIDEISLDSYTRAYIKEIEKKEIQYKFSDIDKNWFFRVSKELENPYELNRYFFGIYFSRKDLHQVFNINKRSGLDDFLRWVNNEIVLGNLHTNLLKYIPDDIKIDNRSSLVRKFILRVSKFLLRKYPFFFTNALVAKFKNFIKRLFFKNYLKKTKSIENKLRLFSKKELPLEKREGFNVFGYFKESTGLAVGANLMTEMLKEAKFKVSKNIVDISDNSIISEEFMNQKIWDISLFHINADQTPNLFPALQKKYLDTFRIGYWAWELERFPSNYLKSGEYLNDLWVPSRFIAESIERSCNFEPKVIPHPVKEHSKNKSNLDKRFDIKDRFVVTGIMDLNSYAERKNPSGILKAFSDACIDKSFRKDAVLVLKLSGSFKKREVLQKINSYKEKHKSQIVVIDEIFSEKEMEGLRNITDVFISLHRSEGFGLNLIENMSAGNLVIATNYSGNKDFMNEKNSLLVDFKMIPVREGDYPEWEGQFWADPSIKDAAEKLIWSFKNHSESDKISKYAKSFINKNFSISKISNDVLKATKSIK